VAPDRPDGASRPALRESLAGAVGVAIAYLLLYELNHWLFAQLTLNSHVSWVFLPAAIRMLAVMLFEWSGVLGLFVGALLCVWFNPDMISGPGETTTVAALSAIAPMLAYVGVRRHFDLPRELTGLTAGHLTGLAIASGVTNAVLHQGYFFLVGKPGTQLVDVVPMFVGDVIGAVLMLYLAASILRLLRPSAY
jgi:hypothetical protein